MPVARRLADIFTIFPVKVSEGCVDVWVRLSQRCAKQGLEFSKRCSRELVRCRGVVSVEGGDEIISVRDIGSRFPSRCSITFPFDKVLELSAIVATVQDIFDFVFLFAVDFNRGGGRRFVDTVVMPGTGMVYVYDRVDFEEVWKLETIVKVADTFQNFKRTELTRAKLRTVLVDFDILGS